MLGIWHISWGGLARCTGAGGVGSARFSFGDPLREGPCGTWRESDPPLPEVWIHRSTALGVCRGAGKFPGRNRFPLGFWLGDGRGRWHRRAPLFPAKLRSVVPGAQPLSLPLEMTFGKHLKMDTGCQGSDHVIRGLDLSVLPPALQGEKRIWKLNWSPTASDLIKHAYVIKPQ